MLPFLAKNLQTDSFIFKCLPCPCPESGKHKGSPRSAGSDHLLDSTDCSDVKSAYACFLRQTDSVSLHLPDGYTVEDIMLYWEGDDNAVQGTEKLHIPQFTLLGKTVTSKQERFYTGGFDPFLVSCLFIVPY